MTDAAVRVDDVRLSDHARMRAAEMGIRSRFVKDTVRDPEVCYSQHHRDEGNYIAQRGEIAVGFVMVERVAVVLTVLRRVAEEYVR